ncbi:MAG: hypothetical protein IMW95_06115 [Moorella humiferrea]|uniref:Uncharacterized protein n=1 Tax=Neomoorella humiferrea TaxID=676965 RepID=A0A2T0AQA9_9FIRM|nr:hypothetical protein [Moorella humiferrea]MBE3572509.1 hypothetical protein [Moorella humiferrea]PRR71228.1 hypothetical protein MOHU_16540 [Moorella humiferrea]
MRQKLVTLLKDCLYVLEKVVDAPYELRQMQEQVERKIAEIRKEQQSGGKKVA